MSIQLEIRDSPLYLPYTSLNYDLCSESKSAEYRLCNILASQNDVPIAKCYRVCTGTKLFCYYALNSGSLLREVPLYYKLWHAQINFPNMSNLYIFLPLKEENLYITAKNWLKIQGSKIFSIERFSLPKLCHQFL